MGILRDSHQQPGQPPNAQFATDSVLGRMARGGYKPTEEELAELQQLAQTGNRAERRAAGKHLKKHGVAAPAASPKMPVVAPAHAAAPEKNTVAAETAPQKAPAKKAAPAKTAAKKTEVKKAAAKKAPAKKAGAKKTPAKKAPAKKAPAKKAAAKKAPPKKAPRRKS